MRSFNGGVSFAVAASLALSACGGSGAVPSSAGMPQSSARSSGVSSADSTSVLKQLKKNVEIGSTVDPGNGDRGPYAIAVVPGNRALHKGQLVVCNVENDAGVPGNGTTIELFDPTPGSSPATFAQGESLAGCDGLTIDSHNTVFTTAYTADDMVALTPKGQVQKKYSRHSIKVPFGNVFVMQGKHYQAAYDFIADAATGSILSLSYDIYGTGKVIQVATGFAVNMQAPLATLGPSGLQYDAKHDVLYIVDGVDNTIVAFSHASDLLVKDEIVVKPGGKTFECKYPKTTCASLVYSGSPLNAPMASALLPNGNLVVANTQGGNALVELTPAGRVLDTKVVDKSKIAGIFGLVATGKSDSDTAVYFTDTNSNELRKLER
jgi:sugar lactone lactonase YvrE